MSIAQAQELPPVSPEAPQNPPRLVALPKGATEIELTWEAGSSLKLAAPQLRYAIWVSPDPVDPMNRLPVAVVTEPGKLTHRLTGLKAGTSYRICVRTWEGAFNYSSGTRVIAMPGVPVVITPPPGPDAAAPSRVTDLSARVPTDRSAVSAIVTWTAPGDDGTVGTASRYELRYSNRSITAANWSSALLASGLPTPSPAGARETFVLGGLKPRTLYYVAIRALDEVSKASALSNVAAFRTLDDPTPPLTTGAKVEIFDPDTKGPVTIQSWTDRLHVRWNGFSDSESGIAEYRLKIQQKSASSWSTRRTVTLPGDRTQDAVSYTLQSGKTYRVSVEAENRAGERSAPVFSNSVDVIVVAPPETYVRNGPSATGASAIAFFELGSSALSAHYQRRLDGESVWRPAENPLVLAALASGPHRIEFRAIFPAGNPDPTPATYSWIVDPKAQDLPSLGLPSSQTALKAGDAADFSWSLPAGVTLKKVILRVRLADGRTIDIELVVTVDGRRVYARIPIGNLDPSAREVQFVVVTSDATGKETETASDGVAVDSTAPAWTAESYVRCVRGQTEIFFTNQNLLDVRWSGCADADSGVSRYEVAVGTSSGAADVVAWGAVTVPGSALAATLNPMLTNGTVYFVSVRAINGAGLVSAPRTSSSLTCDTVRPAIVFQSAPASPSASSVEFLYSANETGCIYRVRLDGGIWNDLGLSTRAAYSNLSTGRHSFEVKTLDRAGNESDPVVHLWDVGSASTPPPSGTPTPKSTQR